MSNRAVLRRLKKLERVFALSEPQDDWVDIILLEGSHGGIFGHLHYRFSESRRKNESMPCSDEEEIAIMRDIYEETEHKLPRASESTSFAEFLEYYSYLGSEEMAARRKMIIEQLKR